MTTLHDILLDLGRHHVSVEFDRDGQPELIYIIGPHRDYKGEVEIDITDFVMSQDHLMQIIWEEHRAEQQAHAEAVADARADR